MLDEEFLRPVKKLETPQDLENYARARGWENWKEMDEDVGFSNYGIPILGTYVYTVDTIPDDDFENLFDEIVPKAPVEKIGRGTYINWHYFFPGPTTSQSYRIYTLPVQLFRDATGQLFMEEVED